MLTKGAGGDREELRSDGVCAGAADDEELKSADENSAVVDRLLGETTLLDKDPTSTSSIPTSLTPPPPPASAAIKQPSTMVFDMCLTTGLAHI